MKDKAVAYMRDVREEMRKVTWPTRKQVVRDTIIVVAISLAAALYFGVIDYGLSELLGIVITNR
jgi:preprotein translocase subunit SecE